MMRVGHLFDLSPSERREILNELCDPEELDDRVKESQLPVESFAEFGPATMRALHQGLQQAGRELGEELSSQGHFVEHKWDHYRRETDSAIKARLYAFITHRIGEFKKAGWKRGWHILNTALFVLVFIAIGVLDGADSENIAGELLVALWMISVCVMVLVRLSDKPNRSELERRNLFDGLYAELAKPLLEGIHEELLRAGKHKKMEELVTRQSWPGRGMPKDQQPQERREFSSPSPRRFVSQSTTARRAEELCAKWLHSRGESSAEVTPPGADGGVDIRGRNYIAQVKNYKGSVGVQPIREIYGIATAEGKSPIFFTSGTYTRAAVEFADSVRMPLITYDAALQSFSGVNSSGRTFVR
jgi:hypothetical protein